MTDPHYPSIDKDYFPRLSRFAAALVRAEEIGLRPFLAFNREHKRAVGLPTAEDEAPTEKI